MADSEKSTVYIVDDDASVRRGLTRLLRMSAFAVEEFASAEEFLRRDDPSGTGCLLLDVRMPHMTGPELFDRLTDAGYSLPVIFLTAHGDVPTSVHAMKHGAVDFLLKPVDGDVLLRAIEVAIRRHAASRVLERGDALIRARLDRLSRREREVMEHVIQGQANKLIAGQLGISEKTVKVHRHRVMEKMEVRSVAELVRLADAASLRAQALAGARGSG